MKTINAFTNLFTATMFVGFALLITLTVNLELYYELAIILLGAILGATVYYLASRYEKQLESDLATEGANYDVMKIKYKDSCEEIDRLRGLLEKYENNDVPFAEDSQPQTEGYVCPKCNSSNVRETAHYVICNDCGKRKKKTTYGVKLTKSE